MTGVASPDIRTAEKRLEEALEESAAAAIRPYRRRAPRSLEMMSTD
jgi:hypothetical protein